MHFPCDYSLLCCQYYYYASNSIMYYNIVFGLGHHDRPNSADPDLLEYLQYSMGSAKMTTERKFRGLQLNMEAIHLANVSVYSSFQWTSLVHNPQVCPSLLHNTTLQWSGIRIHWQINPSPIKTISHVQIHQYLPWSQATPEPHCIMLRSKTLIITIMVDRSLVCDRIKYVHKRAEKRGWQHTRSGYRASVKKKEKTAKTREIAV